MAVATGTASGPNDLFDKLIDFLTTDPDLVAAEQAWEVVWEEAGGGRELVVRGPGLSGEDQIYVGLKLTQRSAIDSYYIEVAGMTGILPEATTYRDHINSMSKFVRMFTDVGTVSYWFVANGRRFIVVLKISTVFEAMYAGLFLPYGTPVSYPYPLFIGGSAGDYQPTYSTSVVPVNWRTEADNHRHFVWGHANYPSGVYPVGSTGWMLSPDGEWRSVANNGESAGPVRIAPEFSGDGYHVPRTDSRTCQPQDMQTRLVEAYGGDRMLWPSILVSENPNDVTYGVLDGVYRCQGVANSAENLITVNGKDHLVVQNVFRTDFQNYWAMVLE